LRDRKDKIIASDLANDLNIDYVVLMSAINDLISYELGGFKEEEINHISLNKEGLIYLKSGLPERQLLEVLIQQDIKEIQLDKFIELSKMEKSLFYIGLSNLKQYKWVAQSKASGESKIFLTAEEFPKTEIEEFLHVFNKKQVLNYSELSPDELTCIDILNKRKLINKTQKTQRILYLTEEGKKLDLDEIEELRQVSKISSEMLSTGSWKDNELKSFDVTKPGPLLKAGKIHPIINLINEIREVFLSMGFTEIRGPIVESAFFNFDALYQPQDHPARELHDTFYLSNPKITKLPDKERVLAVKETHEKGGDSGSTGWRYEWNEDIAKKALLRTHTTATTIRKLAQYYLENDKKPIKVFSIDRVFRNEKVDKSHLAEFTQIEGIVIDDNVNLCDLIGLLSEIR